jgi:hypothetical protein
LLLAANKVMTALGADALPSLPLQPVKWKRKATRVVVEFDEECFWIELSPVT